MLALLATLTLASGCDANLFAENRGPERAQAVCAEWGNAFTNIRADREGAEEEAQREFERASGRQPVCMLIKEKRSIRYQCSCEPKASLQTGKMKVDFGKSESPLLNYDEIEIFKRACDRQREQVCGSKPPSISVECESEWGSCSVDLDGERGSKLYNSISRDCQCKDRRVWSQDVVHKEGLPLTEPKATAWCEQELRYCEPNGEGRPVAQGPGPDSLVPDTEIQSQTIGCGHLPEKGQADCDVGYFAGELSTRCECGFDESSESVRVSEMPSYEDLKQRCHAAYTRCAERAQAVQGETEP